MLTDHGSPCSHRVKVKNPVSLAMKAGGGSRLVPVMERPKKITFAENARLRRSRSADLLQRLPLQPFYRSQRRSTAGRDKAVRS
jgi:hypothetical protein